MERVLITGGAGFIGTQLARALMQQGVSVTVLDNFDPFYDLRIKNHNAELLAKEGGEKFRLIEGDIRESESCELALQGADAVVHLAALAGVRPSILDPVSYMDVNVRGTQILLDAVVANKVIPFIFASSSSVYGGNMKVPFAESDAVNEPVSPYAASKRAGELICHTFHHLTDAPVTCLRFFTVYGPGQRPEMAIHRFSRHIVSGEALPFFGDGTSRRDYTYVDDIVGGVIAALERADGYHIYNLGGAVTTSLGDLVAGLETVLGKKAILEKLPEQQGDVKVTYADIELAKAELNYESRVSLEEGLRRFADWYLSERSAGRLE